MIISYISLGSNIARASSSLKEQLEIAINAISIHPKISLEKISSFYQSSPIGPKDQPDYVNAVVQIKTDLNAITLLRYLQEIENNNGR
jgi:2-amino-4-hydroxy-6-hydroxymethyldihydropteridine diphosphokinase